MLAKITLISPADHGGSSYKSFQVKPQVSPHGVRALNTGSLGGVKGVTVLWDHDKPALFVPWTSISGAILESETPPMASPEPLIQGKRTSTPLDTKSSIENFVHDGMSTDKPVESLLCTCPNIKHHHKSKKCKECGKLIDRS